MKQKRIILLVVFFLAAMVALLAVLHLSSGKMVKQGQVEIIRQDQKQKIDGSDIARIPVKGELVNGKGEARAVDAKGSLLADVLSSVGIDPAEVAVLKVTAQDEFSAEISGEELLEKDKVYLISEDDGTVALVVFGDSNAKRNVKNVARIEVDPE
ncbi:MAG: hypothetical protein J6P72_01860 [Firmicutes bacterium]|nr:hypothetical protein [Bacillota bacterium]